ncbi:MAG: ABC transporter permease, partial [Planctomycetales bacterium]|nr:ABC transporter permease [Planctomycetales bacterium]
MNPYLAILIDSFWEAVGNRVLWALLLGWSLVLIGLAPFGYVTERSYRLTSSDIDNRGQLMSRLAKGTRGQGRLAVVAVAKLLDEAFVDRLRQADDNNESQSRHPITSSELAEQLNQVLSSKELYSPEAFPTAKARDRLLPLIESAERRNLDANEAEELNRELLQQAFPLELSSPRGEHLWVGYAGFKIGDPLPVSRRQIRQFIEPVLLAGIIKFGLGILAVFVAIVVTSPMIPDTFSSGALHLLLSKPISRVWLYLAKFFGGCIFVLVNITFVLIGLYFIAGLRFDIWNLGLLVCIPILMFVFVIFYSVSALVGLIWGNAIVCVVACMLFWLFCFSLGVMHDAIGPQVEVMPQISRIRTIEGHLMTVDQRGRLGVWNEQFSIWQPAINDEQQRQARTFGPIYNAERRLILTKSFFRDPFGGLHAKNRRLAIIHLANDEASDASDEELSPHNTKIASDAPMSIKQARETPVWLADAGPDLPPELFDVVSLGETVIAVCRSGLFRLD